MVEITVSVPKSVKDFLEREAAREGFPNVDEYVREMLRRIQRKNETDAKLREGLSSSAKKMTEKRWAGFKSRLKKRFPELET